jgi:surfactin family lipopeptide synthetase A
MRLASTAREALTADEARLWLATRMRGDAPSYNIPFFVDLDVELDVAAFEAAFAEAVRRHAALRTQIRMIDGRPFKHTTADVTEFLGHHDLSALGEAERQSALSALQQEIAQHAFDIENGPVYRAVLVHLGPTSYRLIFCVHHIAFDARSKDIFLRDLSAFYDHFAKGAARPRPAGPSADDNPLDEFADTASNYWRDKLANATPLLQLPVPVTRAPVASYRGRYQSSAVDAEAWKRLKAHAKARGATETVTLKALCDVLLYRFGLTDTVIGTPVSKRLGLLEDEPVGYGVRVCLLRTRFVRDSTFDDIVTVVLNDFLDCLDHPTLDFEAVVRATGHVKDEAFDPFWQVLFSHVTKEPAYRFDGIVVSAPFLEPGYTKADLELSFIESERELGFRTHARADLFDADAIERIHAEFRKLISALALAPNRPISEVFRHLEAAAPVVRREQPADSVVKRFLWHAEKSPDRPALVTAGRNVTYAELRVLAMTFVERLAARGVREGTRAGVCMRPSEHSVAAQLAVMAMGLCCKPLDFSLPGSQLRRALGNLDSGLVIADADFEALFDTTEVELLLPTDQFGQEAEARSLPSILDSAAAMVLSGSAAGECTLDHAALARMVEGGLLVMQSDAANAALTAPAWTELGALQTFVPLCTGGCICVSNTPGALKAALRGKLRLHWFGTAADLLRWSEDADWAQTVAALHPISVRPLGITIARAFRQQGLRIGDRIVFGGGGIGPMLSGGGTRPDNGAAAMRPLVPLCILSNHGSFIAPGGYGELHAAVPSAEAGQNPAWQPTGWRARMLENGQVALAGRITDTWHANGGPVDLGDIEARLEEHPDVALAIAVAADHRRGAPSVLAGQLVAGARLTPQEAKDVLASSVAKYLLPNAIVLVDRLPRRIDGTLDAEKILAQAAERPRDAESSAADQSTAAVVSQIWAEVLGNAVGRETNFFDAGGDSLKLVRLNERLNTRFGLTLKLVDLFRFATVRAMSAHVEKLLNAADGQQIETALPVRSEMRSTRRIAKRRRVLSTSN